MRKKISAVDFLIHKEHQLQAFETWTNTKFGREEKLTRASWEKLLSKFLKLRVLLSKSVCKKQCYMSTEFDRFWDFSGLVRCYIPEIPKAGARSVFMPPPDECPRRLAHAMAMAGKHKKGTV